MVNLSVVLSILAFNRTNDEYPEGEPTKYEMVTTTTLWKTLLIFHRTIHQYQTYSEDTLKNHIYSGLSPTYRHHIIKVMG